jgi:hypothetical protein
MPDIAIPPDLVDLQRRANAAWAAVEEHRKEVDQKRRDAPRVVVDGRETLRDWTPDENAVHARLMAEVTAAADARLAGLAAAGLGTDYDVVQALHAAARG